MRSDREMVAYALEVDPQLLPHIPQLLSDLEELGSDAEWITEVAASLSLPNGGCVVDLGCGKGAVAVEIAEELGLRVLGIDLFKPFIDSCNLLAAERGVSDLCEFRFGNIVTMSQVAGQFDLAVYSALGDVLGSPDETVKIVREYVRSGGFIMISDVCLVEGGSNDFPGFEKYLPHDETVSMLTASGDELLKKVVCEEQDTEDEDEADQILLQARKLAEQYPELEDALMRFAFDQAQENDFVNSNFIDVIWILRKA